MLKQQVCHVLENTTMPHEMKICCTCNEIGQKHQVQLKSVADCMDIKKIHLKGLVISNQRYVWRGDSETFNPKKIRCIWGCFADSGSGALQKMGGECKLTSNVFSATSNYQPEG